MRSSSSRLFSRVTRPEVVARSSRRNATCTARPSAPLVAHLLMSELQYAVNQGKDAVGLPGTYKVGGWFASADFNDLHLRHDRRRHKSYHWGADPSATPLKHSGDGGIYAVADQMVWRGKQQSLSLFLAGWIRAAGSQL